MTPSDRIPVLDLTPEIECLWAELNDAIQGVLRSTQFINGPDVERLESEFCSYLGTAHGVALNSGTDALVIGLRSLGVGPGDEVITTPFTFFATAEAVSILGAKPIFVDIDDVTYNLDASQIEAHIGARTKALLPVHIFGHAAPMTEIMSIAERHALLVLEDTAQGFSGEYRGRKLGSIGHAGAYSFFPSKNLGAFGDAGLLTANDAKLAEQARMLRSHGSRRKYYNESVGYNSRMDTLQAAILRVKLRHIEKSTERRRLAARRYGELLAAVDGVVAPTERPDCRHCFHQYTVRVTGGRRDAVRASLQARGIETMVYYPVPLHKLPIYQGLGLSLPRAERACEEVLSLPIWPEIDASAQERVVAELVRALRN